MFCVINYRVSVSVIKISLTSGSLGTLIESTKRSGHSRVPKGTIMTSRPRENAVLLVDLTKKEALSSFFNVTKLSDIRSKTTVIGQCGKPESP